MKKLIFLTGLLVCTYAGARSQTTVKYALDKMLKDGKIEASPGHKLEVFSEGGKKGITGTGIVWLPGEFKEGTVEFDLRGRNEFLKSFLGIVFNTADTVTYEDILFRPFNFQHEDAVRRTWSLAYTSEPDYPYDKLRKENTGEFETEILPNPKPEDWLHARIVIKKESVQVFVNGMEKPSLTVKRLGDHHGDKFGLYVFGNGTPGDFANLSVTKED